MNGEEGEENNHAKETLEPLDNQFPCLPLSPKFNFAIFSHFTRRPTEQGINHYFATYIHTPAGSRGGFGNAHGNLIKKSC